MRTSLALAALFALVSGCDAVGSTSTAAPKATLSLDTHAAVSGDVLYTLEPLAPGQTFEVGLDVGDETLRLRSTRHAEGYALTFEPDVRQRPDSVVVRYLANGIEVAPSRTIPGFEPTYAAGDSEEGPDSWHYVWENGYWIIMKDYKKGKNGLTAETTTFTTAAGETVQVTDVAFQVYGLDTAPPSEVRFETPNAIQITERAFSQSLSESLR